MPHSLRSAGVRFQSVDRRDSTALATVLGGGADLLVDALAFTAADAQQLLPFLPGVGATVMLSSKAVYVDDDGRHANSDAPPWFNGPVREDQSTMKPGTMDYDSREGYGPNKVAAEQILLDSGHPVTVIRASKVHGAGASRPREWMFVKRILDRRTAVFLSGGGTGIDHTTAAVNTAALIERVGSAARQPRILNSADPDAPNVLDIARTVARHFGHQWQEILPDGDEEILSDGGTASGLGRHP